MDLFVLGNADVDAEHFATIAVVAEDDLAARELAAEVAVGDVPSRLGSTASATWFSSKSTCDRVDVGSGEPRIERFDCGETKRVWFARPTSAQTANRGVFYLEVLAPQYQRVSRQLVIGPDEAGARKLAGERAAEWAPAERDALVNAWYDGRQTRCTRVDMTRAHVVFADRKQEAKVAACETCGK